MNQSEVFAVPVAGHADYGRFELRRVLKKNYFIGLGISVTLHLAVLGGYHLSKVIGEEEDIPTVKVRIVKYSDLGPPPSIVSAALPPAISVAAAVAKPSIGIPVPVPDAEVSPEQTIATQTEMSAEPSPAVEEFGEGEGVEIAEDIVIGEDEPGMDEFIPVEKPPAIVKKVMPEYPEMAVRAGLEGTVWVKILVDKDGKPKKAVVVKSTAEMFDEAALTAAMGFLFTPAVMNQGPVKVWVSIPFKFQLKDAKVPS
jgi:protein TonB